MRPIAFALPVLLALAACDNGVQGADSSAEEAAADGDLAANSSVAPVATETPAAAEIPAAIRGRWGLAAGDCETGRDDAKGLLTIGADTLEFYESVGTLDEVEESGPTLLRGTFDFIGEGMSWQRELLLEVTGTRLVRREYGQDAAPEPFRYSKCD